MLIVPPLTDVNSCQREELIAFLNKDPEVLRMFAAFDRVLSGFAAGRADDADLPIPIEIFQRLAARHGLKCSLKVSRARGCDNVTLQVKKPNTRKYKAEWTIGDAVHYDSTESGGTAMDGKPITTKGKTQCSWSLDGTGHNDSTESDEKSYDPRAAKYGFGEIPDGVLPDEEKRYLQMIQRNENTEAQVREVARSLKRLEERVACQERNQEVILTEVKETRRIAKRI
ncbi:hypothetical protein L596_015891 [Steinernema carpocapsae]|uniref:Uncharacterized protein n=1 Tax=Steinernema carpocapsae TaxID=34508 RepID=A0A4U5NGG2_STECR|nr:hypothetical protein L596_015891 [Steinernema carpocapsae]